MYKSFLFSLCFLFCLESAAQTKAPVRRFIRFSGENDGINAWFRGTDWGYTNGLRIDYFQTSVKKQRKIHQKIRLFSSAYTVYGWGIEQIMITPQKTRPAVPDKNDYPYAGSITLLHTRHKADPARSLNLSMTWTAGLMGPASLAKQSQVFLHRLIGDPRPNGWDYQLPTDLLLNYQLSIEKKLTGDNHIKLIAGGAGDMGTLRDGLTAFTILRYEKGLNYFGGLHRQQLTAQPKKPGYTFQLKPAMAWTVYNALLDGGLFNKHSPLRDDNASSGTLLKRKKIQTMLDILLQISFRKFSFSFTQKFFSPDFKGYADHKVGNITLVYGW